MKKMYFSLSKGCYLALQNWIFVGTEFMSGQMWDTDFCFKIFKFKMNSLSFAFMKSYDVDIALNLILRQSTKTVNISEWVTYKNTSARINCVVRF